MPPPRRRNAFQTAIHESVLPQSRSAAACGWSRAMAPDDMLAVFADPDQDNSTNRAWMPVAGWIGSSRRAYLAS